MFYKIPHTIKVKTLSSLIAVLCTVTLLLQCYFLSLEECYFLQSLEEDFAESRREGAHQMTVDDFHSLLTLARYDMSLSCSYFLLHYVFISLIPGWHLQLTIQTRGIYEPHNHAGPPTTAKRLSISLLFYLFILLIVIIYCRMVMELLQDGRHHSQY